MYRTKSVNSKLSELKDEAWCSNRAAGRLEMLDKCMQLARDCKHQREQSGDYLILTVTQLPVWTPDAFAPASSPGSPQDRPVSSKCFQRLLADKFRNSITLFLFFLFFWDTLYFKSLLDFAFNQSFPVSRRQFPLLLNENVTKLFQRYHSIFNTLLIIWLFFRTCGHYF